MKIPLNVNRGQATAERRDAGLVSEQDLTACREGDWEARQRVLAAFAPLLTSLARQRSSDPQKVNACLEAGKTGLLTAIRKYKAKGQADKFQIFALDFIEKSMDKADRGRWSLFGLFRKG